MRAAALHRLGVGLAVLIGLFQPAPQDAVIAGRLAARGGARAVCSPREPFSPPIVATIAMPGLLILDTRHGLAIVISSLAGSHAATVSLAEFDAATGATIRANKIVSLSVSPVAGAASEALYAAVAEDSGRIFVVHVPFSAGNAPAGRVDVLDERSLRLLRTVPLGGLPGQPVLDPGTGRVFIANQQSGTVSVLDAATGQLVRTVAVAPGALGPTPAPVVDARAGVVFALEDLAHGGVAVLDAGTGAVRRHIAVGPYPRAAALDSANGRLLVADHGDGRGGSISLIDAAAGRLLRSTALPGSPVGIAIDAATHRAFVNYDDSFKVSMLDTASGALLGTQRVRADTDAMHHKIVIQQPGDEHPPTIARIDEKRRWAIVDVPPIVDDDGPEPGSGQIVVLDSSTGGIVHTVITLETGWPNAATVDNRRGRAFTYVGAAIVVYDISCIAGRYNFANLG